MTPSRKRQRDVKEAKDGSPNGEVNTDAVGSPPPKKLQQRRSLFIRSLPATATTQSLVTYFSQSYPIKHAIAVIDPATKKCKGYGFVTFADAEDAQRASEEFNGSVFEGRKIKIEVAEPRHRELEDAIPGAIAAGQTRPRSVPSAASLEAKAKRVKEKEEIQLAPRLIVRNLPWSIKTPEQLGNLFRSYGKIKQAVLPSKKPGLMSGFGFVLLRGRKNAEKAMEGVNGKEIDGRTLAVDWAVDKETWEKETKATVDDEDLPKTKPVSEVELSDDQAMEGNDEEETGVLIGDDEDSQAVDSDVASGQGAEELDDLEDTEDEVGEAPSQEDRSTTLFIRNLPFTTSDEDLKEHFTKLGLIRYARVVMDQNTERPRGTGFVCFVKAEDALKCLREAPKPNRNRLQRTAGSSEASQSILQNEADDPSGNYTIDGCVLQLSHAVDKSEATRLTEEGINRRGERDKDKRRLYLLSEGTISSNSPLYALLSPAEIGMRDASSKQRSQLIRSNPSLHLSLTRLSVRNIPRSVTSRDLKALARDAVVGFAKDVKEEKRQRLSKEELARGGEAMVNAEKERKKRGVGVVKQAKVVFEGREGGKVTEDSGGGRSRGYGFIEYYTHRSALMGLRWLNGHVIDYKAMEGGKKAKGGVEERVERKKRLIVEFAIENAQVVNRRRDREQKARSTTREDGQRQRKSNAGEEASGGLFRTVDHPSQVKTVREDDQDAKKPKVNPEDKQAVRQRIIGKKRAMRRLRKNGAA